MMKTVGNRRQLIARQQSQALVVKDLVRLRPRVTTPRVGMLTDATIVAPLRTPRGPASTEVSH